VELSEIMGRAIATETIFGLDGGGRQEVNSAIEG